ncbi:MAG TPA: DUF6714 family protein [Kofleriaceae bacterium]|jgi:hypothetical protein|nr:DUF6714 family protein [Kofleriaceae bacterium]
MPSPDSDAVRAQIVAAWHDAVAPGDDKICAPTYDDEGIGAYFRGRTWQGHEVQSLRYHSAGLSFFTAEGFAYYLAAYLLAVIDDARAADTIIDSVLFHLSPTQLDKTWGDSYLARLACLSPAQRRAVIAYLEWCALRWDFASGEIETTIAYLRTGRVAEDASPLARLLRLASQVGRDPQTIERVSLSNTKVTDTELVALRELPALRELDLGGTAITDAGLAEVGAATTLEILDLSRCKCLTAVGLAHLANLQQLAELIVPNCELDDTAVQALAPLHLRRLEATHARRVTDVGWAALDVSRLERLDMYGVDATDPLLARIGDAGRLRKLTAKLVTDAGLLALARTPVVELDIGASAELTATGLAALAQVPTLRELGLHTPTVEDWPPGWPALEKLTLLDLALGATCAAGFGRLPALRELRVHARSVEAGALAAAARAPALEMITIWASHTPLVLEELGRAPSPTLNTLRAYHAQVTAAGFAALAALPALTRLQLERVAPVDDAAVRALATVRVRELELEDMPVDDAGLAVLGDCPQLRQLRLIRSKATAAGVAAFRKTHVHIALIDL